MGSAIRLAAGWNGPAQSPGARPLDRRAGLCGRTGQRSGPRRAVTRPRVREKRTSFGKAQRQWPTPQAALHWFPARPSKARQAAPRQQLSANWVPPARGPTAMGRASGAPTHRACLLLVFAGAANAQVGPVDPMPESNQDLDVMQGGLAWL